MRVILHLISLMFMVVSVYELRDFPELFIYKLFFMIGFLNLIFCYKEIIDLLVNLTVKISKTIFCLIQSIIPLIKLCGLILYVSIFSSFHPKRIWLESDKQKYHLLAWPFFKVIEENFKIKILRMNSTGESK